jgi:hypothetical protein
VVVVRRAPRNKHISLGENITSKLEPWLRASLRAKQPPCEPPGEQVIHAHKDFRSQARSKLRVTRFARSPQYHYIFHFHHSKMIHIFIGEDK